MTRLPSQGHQTQCHHLGASHSLKCGKRSLVIPGGSDTGSPHWPVAGEGLFLSICSGWMLVFLSLCTCGGRILASVTFGHQSRFFLPSVNWLPSFPNLRMHIKIQISALSRRLLQAVTLGPHPWLLRGGGGACASPLTLVRMHVSPGPHWGRPVACMVHTQGKPRHRFQS